MWWKWGESLRHQTPLWDCSVVCVCVGKVGTELSQGSAGSLESEGPGVPSKKLELCPEGRGECQSQARKEEADPPPPNTHTLAVLLTVWKAQEGTSALSPFLLLTDDGGSWVFLCAGPSASLLTFFPIC